MSFCACYGTNIELNLEICQNRPGQFWRHAWSLMFTDDPRKMYPAKETAARRAVNRSSTARSMGPRSTAERAGTMADAFHRYLQAGSAVSSGVAAQQQCRLTTPRSIGPRNIAERAGTVADFFTVTCKQYPHDLNSPCMAPESRSKVTNHTLL